MFEKSLLFQYEINQILSLLDNIFFLGGGAHKHARTDRMVTKTNGITLLTSVHGVN